MGIQSRLCREAWTGSGSSYQGDLILVIILGVRFACCLSHASRGRTSETGDGSSPGEKNSGREILIYSNQVTKSIEKRLGRRLKQTTTSQSTRSSLTFQRPGPSAFKQSIGRDGSPPTRLGTFRRMGGPMRNYMKLLDLRMVFRRAASAQVRCGFRSVGLQVLNGISMGRHNSAGTISRIFNFKNNYLRVSWYHLGQFHAISAVRHRTDL
jgi:hypothetical protein